MINKDEILQSFIKQANVINAQIVNDDYQGAISGVKLLATYLSVKLNEREGGNEKT